MSWNIFAPEQSRTERKMQMEKNISIISTIHDGNLLFFNFRFCRVDFDV